MTHHAKKYFYYTKNKGHIRSNGSSVPSPTSGTAVALAGTLDVELAVTLVEIGEEVAEVVVPVVTEVREELDVTGDLVGTVVTVVVGCSCRDGVVVVTVGVTVGDARDATV